MQHSYRYVESPEPCSREGLAADRNQRVTAQPETTNNTPRTARQARGKLDPEHRKADSTCSGSIGLSAKDLGKLLELGLQLVERYVSTRDGVFHLTVLEKKQAWDGANTILSRKSLDWYPPLPYPPSPCHQLHQQVGQSKERSSCRVHTIPPRNLPERACPSLSPRPQSLLRYMH